MERKTALCVFNLLMPVTMTLNNDIIITIITLNIEIFKAVGELWPK